MNAVSHLLMIGLSFSVVFFLRGLTLINIKKATTTIPPLLVFILSVELLYGWLFMTESIFYVPHALRLNTSLVFLLGPAIFLFIRSLIEPELKWKWVHLLHIIPFIIVFIYFIPLYISPPSVKLEYMRNMYVSLPDDSIVFGAARRIQQGIYLIAILSLIVKKKRHLKLNPSANIVYFIFTLYTLLWLISMGRYLFSFHLLTGLIDSIALSAIAVFLVYYQISVNKIYHGKSLDPYQFQQYEKHIKYIFQFDKDFLNPNYTIQDLSHRLDLSVSKVSRIINQGMETNFNNLINSYRVEKAIELLSDKKYNCLTIEAISKQSGFNSTSSFNYNFKKLTGKTPKQYRP